MEMRNPDVPAAYGNPFETFARQKDEKKIGVDEPGRGDLSVRRRKIILDCDWLTK